MGNQKETDNHLGDEPEQARELFNSDLFYASYEPPSPLDITQRVDTDSVRWPVRKKSF